MAVRARQALDFQGVLAATGRPTIEIALGRPTHQHEGAVAEEGIVDRLQHLHERNIPILTWDVSSSACRAVRASICSSRARTYAW
jgi:hypothetical protein